MREIIFNAIEHATGFWVEGDLINYSPTDKRICPQNERVWDLLEGAVEVIPETICQYTGLRDKNNVRIFEGDILLLRMPSREYEDHFDGSLFIGMEPLNPKISTFALEVVFKDASFQFINTDSEISFYPNEVVFKYTKRSTIEAFSESCGNNEDIAKFWEGEQGSLQYLLQEYGLKNEEDLISYLGLEVIGNKFDDPEMLEQ